MRDLSVGRPARGCMEESWQKDLEEFYYAAIYHAVWTPPRREGKRHYYYPTAESESNMIDQ